MVSLKSIISGQNVGPPRELIHGVAGVGKTTFGAGSNKPIFIQTEDGADVIGAERFPKAEDYKTVVEQIDLLTNETHNYRTVVIDSLDWLEPLVNDHICQEKGKADISSFGYGEGYKLAASEWRQLLNKLGELRKKQGMVIIMLAHTQVKTFHDPSLDSYDRYQIKLNNQVSYLCMENSDLVGFANYKTTIREGEEKFSRKTIKAVGAGERVLYTQERPAWIAKSRYAIPDQLEFSWDAVNDAIKATIEPEEDKENEAA